MTPIRNRAQGWTHAKLSGHENESRVAAYLKRTKGEAASLLHERIFGSKSDAIEILTGGLHESNVACALGGTTKSKTDLLVRWSTGNCARISIKKSRGGQVYLISLDRFIAGMESHFGPLPSSVKIALELYFGPINSVGSILRNLPPPLDTLFAEYQIEHRRLVWTSLMAYRPSEASALLKWLRDKQQELFLFCFSRGLAKNPGDWTDTIWYVNLLGLESEDRLDKLFRVADVVRSLQRQEIRGQVIPGSKNGGSTIQLPFGFIQWHQGHLQFHHALDKMVQFSFI